MTLYQIEIEGTKFEVDAPTPQAAVRAAKKYARNKDDNFAVNAARALVGQGAGFGWGDEIEARTRSLAGHETYDKIVKDIRDEQDEFRRDNPVAAYGLEFAGAVAPALATRGRALPGPAKAGLGRAVAVNAAQGGLAGAGYAEGLAEKAEGAAMGAAIGGGIGAAARALPKLTPHAKKLLDQGVPLTPGQATAPAGRAGLLNTLEQQMTSLPVIGEGVAARRAAGQDQLFRVQAQRALDVVGRRLNPNATQAIDVLDDVRLGASSAYDDVAKSAFIKDRGALAFAQATHEALELADDAVKASVRAGLRDALESTGKKGPLLRKAFEQVLRGKKPKVRAMDLSGREIVQITNKLRQKGAKAANSGLWETSSAFNRMATELVEAAAKDNPSLSKSLKTARAGWREYKVLERAFRKRKDLSAPRGSDYATARMENAKSAIRPGTDQHERMLHDDALASTFRNTIANSGTPSRTATMGVLGAMSAGALGAGVPPAAFGAMAVPGILGAAYLNPMTTAALRQGVLAPGRIGTAMGGRMAPLFQGDDNG